MKPIMLVTPFVRSGEVSHQPSYTASMPARPVFFAPSPESSPPIHAVTSPLLPLPPLPAEPPAPPLPTPPLLLFLLPLRNGPRKRRPPAPPPPSPPLRPKPPKTIVGDARTCERASGAASLGDGVMKPLAEPTRATTSAAVRTMVRVGV